MDYILTQCDQGNTGAAIAYDSLAHYKPDYILFCWYRWYM